MSNSFDPLSIQSSSLYWAESQPLEALSADDLERSGKVDQASGPAYTVDISEEGREAADKPQETMEDPWGEYFGIKAGTTTLSNGNKQVVSIDGDTMELEEYKNGKLVKKATGLLTTEGVVLDTEIYGHNGKVSQAIHTELLGLDDTKGLTTSARMRRSAQWFDNGQLVRQMQDSMKLESDYTSQGGAFPADEDPEVDADFSAKGLVKAGLAGLPKTLEEIAGGMTRSTHKTIYSASIQEFANGRLIQDMHISQKNTFENKTNRSEEQHDDMAPHTTKSMFQDTNLQIRVSSYDQDGNLIREASFSDSHQDSDFSTNGLQRQKVSVTWYNKGELVKRSQGALTMEESKNKQLGEQPTLLDTLDMHQDALGLHKSEFSSTTPRSAAGLLGMDLLGAGTDGDHFTEDLERRAAKDSYNLADKAARSGTADKIYEIAWENEIYRDGDMVARQTDMEAATKNLTPRDMDIRTGGGLTEDDTPAVLHKSEHAEESFEDGKLKQRAVIASHEFIQEGDREGPDTLKTSTVASKSEGANRETRNAVAAAPLEDVDREFHTAAESMGKETSLTMDDVSELIQRLGPAEDE
ncbi:hypothetical protein [Desulfocurvus sp. DL9XJH121]